MGKELVLEVYTTVKPGMRAAYVQAIREAGIQKKVRAEDGCLCYDYYFSAEDENVLLLCEKWTNSEKQAIHMTQPHMADLKALKAQYVVDTKLVRLEEI